jgi:hypothetical protein
LPIPFNRERPEELAATHTLANGVDAGQTADHELADTAEEAAAAIP